MSVNLWVWALSTCAPQYIISVDEKHLVQALLLMNHYLASSSCFATFFFAFPNGVEARCPLAAFDVPGHNGLSITSIDARLRRASLLWRVVDGVSAKVLWWQCFIESTSNVIYLGNWSKIMPLATMCCRLLCIFGGLVYGAPSTGFRRKRSNASVSAKALLRSAMLATGSWATV